MEKRWLDKYKNGEIVPIGDTDCAPWTRGQRQGGNMNESVMNQNLFDFKKVMDKYDIPFIFIFGSALGLMREWHKPWAHLQDTDVDIMCDSINHTRMKPVVKELEEMGFFVLDKNECPMHDHCFMRYGEKIELWWFDETETDYYYSLRVWYPKHFFENPTKIRYKDQMWNVPNNVQEFLKITYGKDWKLPNPSGSYILLKKSQTRRR